MLRNKMAYDETLRRAVADCFTLPIYSSLTYDHALNRPGYPKLSLAGSLLAIAPVPRAVAV